MIFSSVAEMSAELARQPKAVLVVADSFTICQALELMKNSFSEAPHTVVKTGAALLQALFSPSLFRQKELIIFEGVEELKEPEQQQCAHYLQNPDPHVTLFCSSETLKPSSTLYKAFDKHSILQPAKEAPWDKEARIAAWIQQYCRKAGLEIDQRASSQLAKLCQGNYARLVSELNKLFAFVGDGKNIGQAALDAVCGMDEQHTLWQLSDALLQKDIQRALRVLAGIDRQELYGLVVVRHLRNTIRDLAQMASMIDDAWSVPQISERFTKLKGRLFDKAYAHAGAIGAPGLQKALVLIDEAEWRLKDSVPDEKTLLQTLIIRLQHALRTS